MSDMSVVLTIVGIGVAAVAGGVLIKTALNSEKNNIMTFDEFIEKASRKIDSFILESSKKENINYYGGNCNIYISDNEPNKVIVENKIYGKDFSNNWKESTITYKVDLKSFSSDPETKSRLEKIKTEPLKFEVTMPEKKNC